MNVGILYSRVRVEEKLLFEEFERRRVPVHRIDDREVIFELGRDSLPYDVVLERSVNHSRALFALKLLEDAGVPTINRYTVVDTCGNKILTSSALSRNGVPTPRTLVAFTAES